MPVAIVIREVTEDDLGAIIDIDAQNSSLAKPQYWRDAYDRYQGHKNSRFFLVAEQRDQVIGFVLGEIRAWEFGSPPCGWVVVIGVKKDERLEGIGSNMMVRLCDHFRNAGITKIRTMVARQDHELLAFFRSQGLMAGPYQQLEMEIS